MTIKEVAERLDIPKATIHFYEKEKLITTQNEVIMGTAITAKQMWSN